jgi:hypothetical protein
VSLEKVGLSSSKNMDRGFVVIKQAKT